MTDTLGFRLAGYYSKMDGYLDEATPASSLYANRNSKNPDSKDYSVRGTLKWQPSDTFDARLKVNYAQTKSGGPAQNTQYISCPGNATLGIPAGVRQTGSGEPCGNGDYSVNASSGPVVGTLPGTLNSFGDGQNFQDQKQTLAGLEMNFQLSSSLRLTSVTGYYKADLKQCQNYENDSFINLPSCNPTTNRELSQELRLSSDFSGKLNFTTGVYFSDTRAESGSITYLFGDPIPVFGFIGPGGALPWVQVNNYNLVQKGTSYSAYLQGIYKPTDVIEIDVGGRYSYEEKKIPDVRDGGGITEGCVFAGLTCTAILDASTILTPTVNKKDWNDFSPEVTVSYRPSSTLTVFGSYKQGFLSGGFNSSSVAFFSTLDFSYDPETIKGFELGVKSLLLDGNLSLNGAAYTYKVKDLQVTNFVNATNSLVNAGGVKIDGVEADFNFRTPIQGLSIHGAAAYNKGKYTSFPNAPCYNGQTLALGCRATGSQDLGGTELIRAPKLNASFGLGFDSAISDSLKLGLSADAIRTSSYLTDAPSSPQGRMPAFTLIDATIRIGDQNDVWDVALIGKNLSNKHYWVAAPNVPFTGSGAGGVTGDLGDRFAAVSRGKEFYFQVSYKFGGK
jgi:iron complex outermembrane recepter protein